MRCGRTTYFLAGLLLLVLLAPCPLLALPRTGGPVPDFKVVTTTGQPITAQNSRGNVLIIDFFATWCQPCRQTIPHLAALNAKYGKQGLKIVGLSVEDEPAKTLASFAATMRINYPVAVAGEQIQADFGLRSVPMMFIVDRNGKIAEIYRGYSDEIGRLSEEKVKKLLREAPGH